MKKIHLDDTDVRTLSREIILTAVNDWHTIDNGHRKYGLINQTQIDRDDLLEFFFSDWYKIMCLCATNYSYKQLRRGLGITQNSLKEAKTHFDSY